MLKNFVKMFGGDPTKKTVERLGELVEEINALEPGLEALPDEALRLKTAEFRARIQDLTGNVEGLSQNEQFKAEQQALQQVMPEAFAVVREASKRTIGLRPYDVQLIGGAVLHRGEIAEMRTGEGKTLVATLPVYLNSIMGRGVHLVTVNDYLARRDARWMAPIYQMLGLSVGVLQMAAATENGKKAFLVDFERESPHEDQQHLRLVDRVEAYAADVTYGTNSEFGFDYLRDNMTMRLDERVQRGHHFAIVDEVDNVLIDEARTPLIISGPAQGDLEWYGKMAQIVRQLRPEHVEIVEKDRNVTLTEIGMAAVESLLGQPLLDPDRPEDLTPEQARLTGYLEQALRAQFLFKRNKDYLVQGGKVVIVDEFTGRLMPGRRWSDGLHQAVEAKEGVKVEPENVTYATITLQNYFRMYKKLSGMTGTALTEAEEFSKIYKLEVSPIPTNLEYQALRSDATLVEQKAKDEEGYQYVYYVSKDAGDSGRILYRRKDYPDVIYRTLEMKLRAIVQEIVRFNSMGRPMLVGTTSVEMSERLSGRLRREPVVRLMQVLLVRNAWLKANNREEDGRLIPELTHLNEPLESLRPDDLRKFVQPYGLASINPEDPTNLEKLLEILRLESRDRERLKEILQAGVSHEVLNARKHTEESQIIAGAGAFGAVTIATNMAGRGVDIKLGGDLAEEVISAVNRVLRRAGVEDPYDMIAEERRQALLKVDPSLHGIYESEVKLFLQYFEDMERVKALGGLHVIGSERHESRRIDNQLRGRAARQGDPGSSRFYLSLEDDLMRLFGGSQVSGLMERLRVDDSLPLEMRIVGNIIEGSQHRVEGANFDVRKHLLEYDDVLNQQRAQIYSQRDLIFVKEDLHDDILEMLSSEVEKRVQAGLADEEGPWKLIAWLEQVQPPFMSSGRLFPSFGLSLLLKELHGRTGQDLTAGILDLVRRAVELEHAHAIRVIETSLEKTAETLQSQISDRQDALDAWFESLRDVEEMPRPQKMLEELSGLARLPLKLSNDQLRALGEDPEQVHEDIQDLVSEQLSSLYASRMMIGIENRLGEPLGIKLEEADWDDLSADLLEATRTVLERQRERLVGENGQVARDIASMSLDGSDPDTSILRAVLSLTQGARTVFDQRTHRQLRQVVNRFTYVFLAAQLVDEKNQEELEDQILEHLDSAEQALRVAWGQGEFHRLAANTQRLADFGPAARTAFGEERLNEPAADLSPSDQEQLVQALGRYVLNEVHRQLLLGAITELWVDYLTRVEGLRVSIGLEAYAQRDPLVQYKSQASELYQQLLEDIRSQVINRVFAYQPRRIEITPVELAEVAETAPAAAAASPDQGGDASARKRKRKRR
jgi:preprotein translocase subunit SecA